MGISNQDDGLKLTLLFPFWPVDGNFVWGMILMWGANNAPHNPRTICHVSLVLHFAAIWVRTQCYIFHHLSAFYNSVAMTILRGLFVSLLVLYSNPC